MVEISTWGCLLKKEVLVVTPHTTVSEKLLVPSREQSLQFRLGAPPPPPRGGRGGTVRVGREVGSTPGKIIQLFIISSWEAYIGIHRGIL